MSLNFPSPDYVQTFVANGNTWVWDGVAWSLQSSGVASLTPTFDTVVVNGSLTANSLVVTGTVPWLSSSDLTSALTSYATTSSVNSAISAIPSYSLPTASNLILGGVKVDGTTITISNGVISGANTYVLPKATTSVLGGVKPDGTTILVDADGVISGANQYVLPTATTTVKGGVIIPAVATSGITNSSGTIGLATATTTQLGGVIIPAVAASGLTNTSGSIRLATATTTQLGGVKVDGVTITINGSGVIAANITGAIVFQGGWDASTNTPTLNNTSSSYNTNGFEFVTTKSGTVNFGAGNVTFAVGDNVIYDGTKWVKIPIGSSAGTVNSLLTVDNSGSGAVSGTTFNGSSPITISYNSIGASPSIGSSSITTLGTVTTGVWNGSVIGAAYGGTGVANTYTLTVSGANRTLDQSVANGAAPTFLGTNFSGTAANLTVGTATTAGTATSATTAAALSGGAANQIHVQNGLNSSTYITAPSVTDTFLKWTGTSFVWSTVATATTATNLAGGAANRIHYQTGTDTSGFIVAPSSAGTYLTWNGSSFAFSAVTGATGGTVTSISVGAGNVNGLSLASSTGGAITGSGTISIQGPLSLVTPPAIGSTTPNTGQFTILTVNSGSTSAVTLSPTGSGTVTINPTTAGTINNMSIGATTAAAGTFTTLTASSANVSVTLSPTGTGSVTINPGTAGTINNMSIGATTASTGRFTTITSTQATGTAPFTVASTTNVANLNASSLNGATFAAPGAIGSGTASTGVFTTLTYTDGRDTVYTSGSTTGTITPDAANGNVQTITLTGSITLNTLANPVTGQSMTLIIKQPASGGPYTLTSSMLFAGGFKTLSTANNAIDMVTISYIGTSYYASLVTGFA